MQIGIRWLDDESKNYIDMFDDEIFKNDAKKLPIEHDVLYPNGRFCSRAQCLMTVQGKQVTLDYTAFKQHNDKKGMLLGTARFTYDQSSKERILNVEWGSGSTEPTPCPTKYIEKRTKRRNDNDEAVFASALDSASGLINKDLEDLLPPSGFTPPQRTITTTVFLRNPYVVEFTLRRANGKCECCKKDAPFNRPTGKPYLEVHHKVPLAKGGTDDAGNVIAICPNCHREKHFG